MSVNNENIKHMKELTEKLIAADIAYYRDDSPTMTDREYDKLYDELKKLEAKQNWFCRVRPRIKYQVKFLMS